MLFHWFRIAVTVCLAAVVAEQTLAQSSADGQTRVSANDAELKSWLENMLWYHHYSLQEMSQVSGLNSAQLREKLARFHISADNAPARPNDRLFVLPYPGGRHPRIGFLDGALDPQRDTKLSAFAPWDDSSYAVLDFPEALWSNLGLTYLAHTHIDTIWSKQQIVLEKREWSRDAQGAFRSVRRLPNGIELGVVVWPQSDHLKMSMWLTNGTGKPLRDLRVQNCVMLKGMQGFDQQTNENKLFRDGFAVAHSPDRSRWVISRWDPVQRAWGNDQCPCLHSDPQFADCAPGETQWLHGWFSFYNGPDIEAELARIDGLGFPRLSQTPAAPAMPAAGNVVGQVVDAESDQPLPCRLYVQSLDNHQYFFAESTAVNGTAGHLDRQVATTDSIERHTTLSAHPFSLELPTGRYRITAYLGKERLPAETQVMINDDASGTPIEITLRLKRFCNMNARGWYSGDTHVHQPADQMPNILPAEDVNVAFPLSYWVRDSHEVPAASFSPKLPAVPMTIDPQHIYYPINTEYEIFTLAGKPHTQGAVLILNHQQPLELTAPPLTKIATEARRQGALLDLEKHSWNWSIMCVPIMQVDLFELSNNHHWKTRFGFPSWTIDNAPKDWPEVERNEQGFTELGWTEFGLQTYYAFLNCGYRMRVTAGTAAGVHPVPLGYGRVYVHCGDHFDYAQWIDHLDRGHSFVTQGPLIDVLFNGGLPGTTWNALPVDGRLRVQGVIDSQRPLTRVELVHNGIASDITSSTNSVATDIGSVRTTLDFALPIESTSWVALRCFEQPPADAPAGKVIFAHTNPVFIDIPNAPLAPRRRDVEYFISRMEQELNRNRDMLWDEALAEYAEAKSVYEGLLERAE